VDWGADSLKKKKKFKNNKKQIDGRLPKSAINWKNDPSTKTGVVGKFSGVVFPTPLKIDEKKRPKPSI
jgi:hypothetical protein